MEKNMRVAVLIIDIRCEKRESCAIRARYISETLDDRKLFNPHKFRAPHRFQYQFPFNVMRYCDTVLTASLLLAGYPKTAATNNIVVNRHATNLNPVSFILKKPAILLARRLKRSRFWISLDIFPSRLFLHNQNLLE